MSGGECEGGSQRGREEQITEDLTGEGEDLDYHTGGWKTPEGFEERNDLM